ncbi:uncharacterized protein LOC126701728 [Quercus robur]|uniref:uncharacterized protein LOC126701728 n=1 Tax=Quercus robur TaxID=38942 RepID=UPI0021630ADB|nr:uncharacterized protein LOC126701728 [Quercus robur]
MLRPETDEVLFAYLAVATYAISLVLIRVDCGVQKPVYYISKLLHESEVRYLPLEKAILAVVHGTRKLPHYFQSHMVVVLTQFLLRSLLQSANYTRRIAKWGTILGAFDIKYMPRTSVKGQVLADLVAEFAETPSENKLEEQNMDEKSVGIISLQEPLSWKVYVGGAANYRGSGVGLVLVSLERITIEKSLRLGFSATNNEAEYEALLVGMTMVQKMGGKAVEMFSDSRLVVGQVQGELKARDPRMQEYLSQVRHLQSGFESFVLSQVPRNKNAHADSLATLATSSAQGLPRVILVEDLHRPSGEVRNMIQVHQVRMGPSWMKPIALFLKEDVLLENKSKADMVRRKAPWFWLFEDQKLYKRSFSGSYLLWVHPEAVELLLEELHEGIYGSYTGGKSLSHRALAQGYWWPNMQREAQDYVKKCDQCQRDVDAKKFVWKNIVTRFGIPQALISDNGLQFDSKAFRRYCCDLGIKNRTTPRRSTGEKPFSMTYGAEAVIPLETGFPTLRTSSFDPGGNDGMLEKSLDLIEEWRENARVQLAYYQYKLKQKYDANVKLRPLMPGDLVLRKVIGTTKNPTWRKLGPNWERPYCITSVAGIDAYYLEDLEERVVPRPWNAST